MISKLLLFFILLYLLPHQIGAQVYSDTAARRAWYNVKQRPITEETFRLTCDLIQDIAQTNISITYQILAQYVPMVRATGNRLWLHVLLMSWARAKESLIAFDEADSLYRLARENAMIYDRAYDETLACTVLLYLEWGKKDSAVKYISLGIEACTKHKDPENLSFIYTFSASANMEDTGAMRNNLDLAAHLAMPLTDKNALFTAQYNRAIFYTQFNLQEQAREFSHLLELSRDSTLSHKPRLYERTAFSFRGATFSIYYQLILVNLLLTDYDNAWKFAELFYDAAVKPNPAAPQAPSLNAVMAMVRAYQGEYFSARQYLQKSMELYQQPADKIVYPTWQLAAGMIAEHDGRFQKALDYYHNAYKNGSMAYGLHLMPPAIYYAHELLLNKQPDSAQQLFTELKPVLKTRKYSAIGFYYYKYYAALLKAKGDYTGYVDAMENFYSVRDSLSSIMHYRTIQEIQTKMRVNEKEQQILRLNEENAAEQRTLHQQRINLLIFSILAAVIIGLLAAYSRIQNVRKKQVRQIARQQQVVQRHEMDEMVKQHRIDVLQGAIQAEENERSKIADQLHDEAGAVLALASLHISSALEKGKDDPRLAEKMQQAHGLLTEVSSSIRDISHRLTPLVIEKYGFRKAIEDMAHTLNVAEKLKMEAVIIGFADDSKYPVSFLNNLFRIVQELTHNIIKHAKAGEAMIELVEHENEISIIIEDDGVGIKNPPDTKGRGLDGILSKVAYLNGNIEITKKQDKGTLIVIQIIIDQHRKS